MSNQSCCRPLYDKRLAEHFVQNILDINSPKDLNNAVKQIYEVEILCQSVANHSTLRHDQYRDPTYTDERSRKELRKTIFTELITLERLDDDEKITLGNGGALPKGKKVRNEKQAFWIIGLPASGKSSIANNIADYYGAIILDSDYAKRKLPEYDDKCGAFLVHDESSSIVFGEEKLVDYNMLEYCCGEGANIVIPRIGHNRDSIIVLTQKLIDWGYNVHLTLVCLDRKFATMRAYNRFMETGRYVSLSLIFDGYSNEPTITYYRIKDQNIFKSYGEISTISKPPKFVDGKPENPAYILYK